MNAPKARAAARVKTPCIGVCSTGIGDRVCRGCKRFAHEVIHWNRYTEAEKQLIEGRLSGFLSQCVRNKLQVADADLLRRELERLRVEFPPSRDCYCWAYCLLKAAGGQIESAAAFGLLIKAEFQNVPLDELRRIIDEEFFTLSDAYYERYISALDTA